MTKQGFDFEPMVLPLGDMDIDTEAGVTYDEELEEIRIIGEIGEDAYDQFRTVFLPLVATQMALNEAYRQPIQIYLNSIGGAVLQGLNIINEIQAAQSKGIQIQTQAGNTVASMALAIYMVGDIRVCNQFSEFMFHQISGGGSSGEIRHQEIVFQRTNLYWETIKSLTKKYTEVDDEWLDTIYKEKIDFYFFGEEAVELGFADLLNQ